MSKRHRLLLGLAVLALLVFVPAGAALAQEESQPPSVHTLTANGYGLVQVGGWGRVDIHAHGASVIWIVNSDTLEIIGDGEREDMDNGVVKLTGWDGEIHASGERFGVRMAGGELEFTATGKGRATLQGYGTFQVDDRQGRWTWKGVHIPRLPPRAAVREHVRKLWERFGTG